MKKWIISIVVVGTVVLLLFSARLYLFDDASQGYQNDSLKVSGVRNNTQTHARDEASAITDTLTACARKYVEQSRYTTANRMIDSGLALVEVVSDSISIARLLQESGSVYKYAGNYVQSLECYLQAHDIFNRAENWNLLARNDVELAEYYRKVGNFVLARKYIATAHTIYDERKLNDTTLLIGIYNRLAAIDNESNWPLTISIASSDTALHLARLTGNKNAEAISLNELGFSYKNLRKNDSAIACYLIAERIWFSIGKDKEAIHVMNNRAMLYAHEQYPRSQIFGLYNEIIQKVEEKKIDYPLVDAYHYLYLETLLIGDTAKALDYLLMFREEELTLQKKVHDIEVTNITEKYENEKLKQENLEAKIELDKSESSLEVKNNLNKMLFFILVLVVCVLTIIVLLAYRIRVSNRQLQTKNKEKDLLIQEIHHRVKNNLQFVNSLMNMQINSTGSEAEKKSLSDASRRIKAMGLVHELLYNQSEVEGVSIKYYLQELIVSLNDMHSSDAGPILIEYDIIEKTFDISDSVALGMITSEIISNSMKHAFKGKQDPRIHIQLIQRNDRNLRFKISDNGNGFTPNDLEKRTLGTRLIDIFSRQLKGEYTMNGENGFVYVLELERA